MSDNTINLHNCVSKGKKKREKINEKKKKREKTLKTECMTDFHLAMMK